MNNLQLVERINSVGDFSMFSVSFLTRFVSDFALKLDTKIRHEKSPLPNLTDRGIFLAKAFKT